MDRFFAESPGRHPGAEEKALRGRRKRGIVLAVVGALLMAKAVLDGWPAM